VQLYDYQIENDDLQRAANELCDVIEREKARRINGHKRHKGDWSKWLAGWKMMF
jgi:guanylate kinase